MGNHYNISKNLEGEIYVTAYKCHFLSSPPGQSSSAVSLYCDGCPQDPGVSGPCQPSSDPTLDEHSSHTQPLCSQPLQKGHLTSTEKHFGFSKAVLVCVRDKLRQGLSTGGLSLLLALRPLKKHTISAEELLIRPSGYRFVTEISV